MSEPREGQTGGVTNTGTMIARDVVGGNMTVNTTTTWSPTEIHNTWQPIADAIGAAAPEKQEEAKAKLEALKKEVAKGSKAEDGVVAKLVKGLVGLVPTAVSAVGSAFGTPLLSSVAGPVTKFVLNELSEGEK